MSVFRNLPPWTNKKKNLLIIVLYLFIETNVMKFLTQKVPRMYLERAIAPNTLPPKYALGTFCVKRMRYSTTIVYNHKKGYLVSIMINEYYFCWASISLSRLYLFQYTSLSL